MSKSVLVSGSSSAGTSLSLSSFDAPESLRLCLLKCNTTILRFLLVYTHTNDLYASAGLIMARHKVLSFEKVPAGFATALRVSTPVRGGVQGRSEGGLRDNQGWVRVWSVVGV